MYRYVYDTNRISDEFLNVNCYRSRLLSTLNYAIVYAASIATTDCNNICTHEPIEYDSESTYN